MPTLYIANCSKQRHDFVYRIAEETAARRQQIPPGGQITIYQPNAPLEILRSIVDQHAKYGLIDVAEIDRRKPFVGVCFSLDKPIKVEKIMYADEHNADVLADVSVEARKLSAAALHDSIDKATEGAGRLEGIEIEVIEQNNPGVAGLNETVEVSRQPREPSTTRRGRKRGA